MDIFTRAQRFVGLKELSGPAQHPLIQWWFSLCGMGNDQPDEVPWCSAFINGMAWDCRLPRSKSAAARSWLGVGQGLLLTQAIAGDVVILTRGNGPQPGADVFQAPGHVGLFAGRDGANVLVLGGNQNDSVNVQAFNASRVLGVRRLV